jgi:hypothetical protein
LSVYECDNEPPMTVASRRLAADSVVRDTPGTGLCSSGSAQSEESGWTAGPFYAFRPKSNIST